uniref:Integrase catalytic domain-containing protein n=1 Tax=Rhabditophanes sp. KR3021 TaxID=114890 RepID=A0AC35TZ31_9BILA
MVEEKKDCERAVQEYLTYFHDTPNKYGKSPAEKMIGPRLRTTILKDRKSENEDSNLFQGIKNVFWFDPVIKLWKVAQITKLLGTVGPELR